MVVAAIAVASDPADARSRRAKRSGYNPPFASIVVDVNSGGVLQATNPDSRRYPASLAKVMTLYLLFERIESGRYTLDTPLPVSAHAAAQPPTKLGLKSGQSIAVEDAIKALVTKSANDIAVVVAEAIGGSEVAFARMMTQKARELGMRRTTYTNASGLPDSDQITTARDQAVLARAVQERFPRFYRYFATRSFAFRGRTYKSHNRLVGRVDGVDGIKTGYTRASGFNLMTSMRRGKRHVVAVVLGGRSAARRDAHMRDLLGDHIMSASLHRTARPLIANLEPVPVPPSKPSKTYQLAAASKPIPLPDEDDATATVSRAIPTPGSNDPIKPRLVRTVPIKPVVISKSLERTLLKPVESQPAAAAPPMSKEKIAALASSDVTSAAAAPQGKRAPAAEETEAAEKRSGGWMIQVGAFAVEDEAKQRLNAAKTRAKKALAKADPFTEPVEKGSETLYRARFAGLDKNKAEAACRALKRSSIGCFVLKN